MTRDIFEEYITHLQEKAKEKERKREEEKVCGLDLVPWIRVCSASSLECIHV